ncbi:MAG: dihydroorotate dehydrogenase [Candidatus Hadarchaeum sp.]|uniref:dihydroorotate dehydrogenase n=1 Tax=Candidatus Hadarchaeum sp. TaxID=2883567 RepID=UPI003174E99D
MLRIKVGKLKMRNPIMLASGVLCNGSLLKRAATEGGAGAVVTKSLTKEVREGYPTPVIVGVNGGLINAVGLTNPGYEAYLREDLPLAKKGRVPVIVSVAGKTIDEFEEICARAEEAGADAVELNLSCPHVEKHGMEIGADPAAAAKIVKQVRGALSIPVYAKLGLSDKLTESAVSAQNAGADAVVVINTIKAIAIDVDARKPVLTNVYGGLSGPAIHPIALRCVFELYQKLSIPIIGCGGVSDWRTALEFLMAGARAVQVGSALAITGIGIFREIEKGIKDYLIRHQFRSVEEVIGIAQV